LNQRGIDLEVGGGGRDEVGLGFGVDAGGGGGGGIGVEGRDDAEVGSRIETDIEGDCECISDFHELDRLGSVLVAGIEMDSLLVEIEVKVEALVLRASEEIVETSGPRSSTLTPLGYAEARSRTSMLSTTMTIVQSRTVSRVREVVIEGAGLGMASALFENLTCFS
jgi:hypothetical protein